LEKINKVFSLTNYERYLIDYSNLKTGIISNQDKFADKEKLQEFYKNIFLGFPLTLPSNVNYFQNFKINEFKISKKIYLRSIYRIKKNNYKPLNKIFIYGNKMSSQYILKKKYFNIIKKIDKFNLDLKRFIFKLKKKRKIIGAFQTRNIPHLGHEKIIKKFGNSILRSLENDGCKIIGDNIIRKFYSGKIQKASIRDWSKEYLSSIVSVKSVKSLDEAIKHINKYGTMHTDCIITNNKKSAKNF